MKTRDHAAIVIFYMMKKYEGDRALAFSTIYKAIYRDGDVWRFTPRANTFHFNYSA